MIRMNTKLLCGVYAHPRLAPSPGFSRRLGGGRRANENAGHVDMRPGYYRGEGHLR